jgi:hypothetical protein
MTLKYLKRDGSEATDEEIFWATRLKRDIETVERFYLVAKKELERLKETCDHTVLNDDTCVSCGRDERLSK